MLEDACAIQTHHEICRRLQRAKVCFKKWRAKARKIQMERRREAPLSSIGNEMYDGKIDVYFRVVRIGVLYRLSETSELTDNTTTTITDIVTFGFYKGWF
jgi:hypothetical protein